MYSASAVMIVNRNEPYISKQLLVLTNDHLLHSHEIYKPKLNWKYHPTLTASFK